jgi:hypothetical protein
MNNEMKKRRDVQLEFEKIFVVRKCVREMERAKITHWIVAQSMIECESD